MKLSSTSSKFSVACLCSSSGSSITVVLFFAAIGMITVFSYLLHQMSYAKPSLRSPSALQSLFNARSGIYKAFYRIIDSTETDTLPSINTLDTNFTAGISIALPESLDAVSEKPGLDGTPVEYQLFTNDTSGSCEVSMEPIGGKVRLTSIGSCRTIKRRVTALLGCPPPAFPDTVVLYCNTQEWTGTPPGGTVAQLPSPMQVRSEWYNSLIDRYQTDLTETDTLMLDPPLLIQSSHDLNKIKSPVNGPLLIDGTRMPISWNDTSTIYVKGDVQFTGEVTVRGLTFCTSGEIRLLDETKFSNVNLFSASRLFIGDEAAFQGNALALHSITIYGKSNVTGKSSLIAGSSRTGSSGNATTDSLKFTILISEEATVDGVCIALETPGSIKTDLQTRVSGMLWAQHLICHRGKMAGLMYATRFADCDDPLQMATGSSLNSAVDSEGRPLANQGALVSGTLNNAITGEIEPLANITSYHLPFFIGNLSIVQWNEE